MQVRQCIGVDGLLLLHDSSDHWAHDGLADDLGRLCLQESADGDVAVYSLEVGVVAQDFVCDVLGDAFVDVGDGALLSGGKLVPLLLLRLLIPQLFDLF